MRHCRGVIMIADILTKSPAHNLFVLLHKLVNDYSVRKLAVADKP